IVLFRPDAGALQAASGPMGGWDTVTRQVPRIVELSGDHYSLMVEPSVAELARQLKPLLEGGGSGPERP
ncbi:hypothetical protein D7V97_37515, partial [Corallococcus sp. CA053C]|uniref:hypothetical protein n=1 Tax=Corallococcus sp. CA053C TaxID=2316732 RepID=UPI000EC19843